MRSKKTTGDSGLYNRPASIQAPATPVSDGMGGNSAGETWTTVRSPMVRLKSRAELSGIGFRLASLVSQLFPESDHYALMRYASDHVIDTTMTMSIGNRRFRILGAIDIELEHVQTIVGLKEAPAGGSQ